MSLAQRMMKLFRGREDGYGTYNHQTTTRNTQKNGKVEIKSTAKTLRGQVTEELWQKHLDGIQPVGIIPINSGGKCWWGCIDVDIYDISLSQIADKVERSGIPLVPCRTKSGGVHLFMFLNEPSPAELLQEKLHDIAASLGFGGSEIFPKQTTILADRGDLGNWLNMPYFGGDETERYCIKRTGAAMTVGEFLSRAESMQTKLSSVDTSKMMPGVDPDMIDAPPCLQFLTSSGFPEGTRNNGLFALGVFCKKKYGERWQEMLEDFNRRFMKPPLSSTEVVDLVKNLSKREFQYRCKDSPICAHCNSSVCRTRAYGVGGGGEYPALSGLSVLDTDPPLWFVDVDGQRVELNTDQLQLYRMFQKVCMERLHSCYMNMKQDAWLGLVSEQMHHVTKIEAPPESSVGGYFNELLSEFCTDRHRADRREDVLQGKPWEDVDRKRYYFKLTSLMQFLERSKFTVWGRNKITTELRNLGGDSDFFNINGKGCRVMWVPNDFTQTPQTPLPKSGEIPI